LVHTKLRLRQSQDYYAKHYNRKHVDRNFTVGEWVWLKLMAQSAIAISTLQKGKLSPKYFGPYKISEQTGSVAYRLELPPDILMHNAFHVSLLQKYRLPPSTLPPLPTMHEGATVLELEKIIKARLYRGNLQVLIKWKDQPPTSSRIIMGGGKADRTTTYNISA
jgi:hypothetical protein